MTHASIEQRPESLNHLLENITAFRQAKLNLDAHVDTLKHKVGILGQSNTTRPFSPKALEAQLNHIKHHFELLSSSYQQLLSKEKFVQYLLQEPPLVIDDLHPTEQERLDAKHRLDERLETMRHHLHDIEYKTESIHESRQSAMEVADDAVRVLDEINKMENEMDQLNASLANISGMTVDQATEQVDKNRQEITSIQLAVEQKQDGLEEQQWQLEDLQEDIKQLDTKLEELREKVAYALQQNQKGDPRIDREYEQYQLQIDMCNRLFGVEKVVFVSSSLIHVVYQKPVYDTLDIELDTTKDKVLYAFTTNTQVSITDLIKMARQINANDGIRLIVLETLARLKKQTGLATT